MRTPQIEWTEFLDTMGPRGPQSQKNAHLIALFSEGDRGASCYWDRNLDWLIHLPKDESTRSQKLNRFLNLCLNSISSDIFGFQIEGFSTFAPRIWDLLGRGMDERVSFDEILQYYEGLIIVTTASSGEGKAALDFQLEKVGELRQLFGHITILRPDHAETIPL